MGTYRRKLFIGFLRDRFWVLGRRSGLTWKVYRGNKIVWFFFNICCLRTHFWLCWVSATVRALLQLHGGGAYFPLRWRLAVDSLRWILSRWKRGSRAHRLSCSAPCAVFADQGLNPWPLHWQSEFLSTGPPGQSRIKHSKRALVPKHRGNKRWGSGVGCSTANNRRSILA